MLQNFAAKTMSFDVEQPGRIGLIAARELEDSGNEKPFGFGKARDRLTSGRCSTERAFDHQCLRRLANFLVALVVIAVAAAVFVFSYDGVHAIALLGGVSGQLARYYPGLFDAVLVIACVAAVMLRDGRWWARLWAWVVTIVVLAVIFSPA